MCFAPSNVLLGRPRKAWLARRGYGSRPQGVCSLVGKADTKPPKNGTGFVKGRGPGSYGDTKGDLVSKLGVPGSVGMYRED